MKNQIKNLAQEIAFDYNKSLDVEFVTRIKLAVIGYRATIIRQDYNKTGSFSTSLLESFCVPLIQVKETECCGTGDKNCYVWRSQYKIPNPIRTKDGTNFVFVGNTNASQGYDYIVPEEYINIKKGTRFAKRLQYYTHYNGYIYVFNTGNNQKVRVRYVPENPEDLLELKSCDGKPCIEEVNLSEDMKGLIKEWIKAELSGKVIPETEDIKIDGNN